MELLTALFVEHLQETVIAALIAIGVAILGRALLFVIDKLLIPLTRRTRTGLDDVIISALKRPIFFVFLVIGLRIALGRLTFLWAEWPDLLANFLYIAYVLASLFLIGNLTFRVMSWYRDKVAPKTETTLDDQLVPLLRTVLLWTLIIVALLMILSRLGVNISAFLGGLGIGGLALALAAQAVLIDLYAGILLWASRPFGPGDRIGLGKVRDIEDYAVVEDIGLRVTKVMTRDHREVTIPNSILLKSEIINYDRPRKAYRMQAQVAIERGSNLEDAEEAIIKAIAGLAEGKLYGPFRTGDGRIGLGGREKGPWRPEWVSVIKWYDTQPGYDKESDFWQHLVFRGEYWDPRTQERGIIPCPGVSSAVFRELKGKDTEWVDADKEADLVKELDNRLEEIAKSGDLTDVLDLYRETYRPQVYFTEIDGSRLILTVRFWISDCADFRQAQNQLNRAIYYALTEARIKIGRSTTTYRILQPDLQDSLTSLS